MNASSPLLLSAAFAAAIGLCSDAALAQAATDVLTVKIDGLHSDKGQVGCMLFASKDGYPKEPAKAAARLFVAIANHAATCVFANVAPGMYAVAAMHDENGNGKMDTNFLGIPNEGTGASRDARGTLGPPKFDDAKFSYAGGPVSITVPIHY